MPVAGIVAIIIGLALATLVFSALTYSLRQLNRIRLADYLQRHGKSQWLDRTMDHADDMALVTGVWRMVLNTVLVLACYALITRQIHETWLAFLLTALLASLITFFCAVAFPHTLAEYASAEIVGFFVRPLHLLRLVMLPMMGLMRGIDSLVSSASGIDSAPEAEEIEQDIMSAVEEGAKEGVVDEQEREMIESVIQFRDTTVGQIMTHRPDIIAIEIDATLEQVRQVIEESGHSRIPVYSGTLDQIVGIVYARDLLRYVVRPEQRFDLKGAMRPPFYIPETKTLRDLLRDFRLQKVHIAVVLDEYGGTAGLVTLEDILEELIGDISDEHEGVAPMFKRVNETTMEADAAIGIDEINRLAGLNLPEDAGYTTLGGFLSTTLARIPEPGTIFEHNGVKFTVIDAEPQKINRVRIEQSLQPVAEGAGVEASGST